MSDAASTSGPVQDPGIWPVYSRLELKTDVKHQHQVYSLQDDFCGNEVRVKAV